MNNLDLQYQGLLQTILNTGVVKKDRTGTGTVSTFGAAVTHLMEEGFPLLTTKKMAWRGIVSELLWFLRGETNIQWLVQNKNYIWVGDAYKNYTKKTSANSSEHNQWMRDNGDGTLSMYTQEEFIEKVKTDDEFAAKWGELGPIYGKQWRSWSNLEKVDDWEYRPNSNGPIDQIQNLVNDLKNNPDSRRLMVNAWNVAEIDQMVLPPCHYGFQCWTRELSDDERAKLMDKRYSYIEKPEDRILPWLRKDLDDAKIPKRALSLMWNQRSVDTFLGLPFNIASYGLLLKILAEIVNMVPESLIGVLGDTHLYLNHLDQAKEQIGREYTDEELSQMYPHIWETKMQKNQAVKDQNFELAANLRLEERELWEKVHTHTRQPYPLPQVRINTEFWAPGTEDGCGMGPGTYANDMDALFRSMNVDDFQLENYQSHPRIEAPLSN